MSVKREEYLRQLRARLSNRMTPQELENVLAYYGEYFDEAGEGREDQVMEELGSPEHLSHQILGDQVIRELEQPRASREGSRRSGLGAVWTVVLAICAAPIAVPLILGLVAVALGLVVAVLALVLGIGAGGVACVAAGIVSAWAGLNVIFSSGLATTMYFVGLGLLSSGIGVAMLAGAVALARVCFTGIARMLGRAMHRNRREEMRS